MVKKVIKKIIKSNDHLEKMSKKFLLFNMIKKEKDDREHLPHVLQFPITNNCNSRCVMCNVTSNHLNKEMSIDDFKRIINDPLFAELESVGINGGEPFLCKNLIPFIEILSQKNSIKAINIISNGFLTELIKERLGEIYNICKSNNKKLHISFSLDGVGEIHDKVRGIPHAFEKTLATIICVRDNLDEYCDSYDVGCTVVQQNVDYLMELYAFAKKENLPIKYRLGIDNERLYNSIKHDEYSVFSDERSRQTATEFFYFMFEQANNIYDKYKLWSIHTYLSGDEHRRLGCDWQNDDGVTMDGEGTLYYCAVQSPAIGNLKCNSGKDIFFAEKNRAIRSKICRSKCDKCIHDYYGKLQFKNVIKFYKYMLERKLWVKKYK